MTLSLAIALNVVADVFLLGLLAYVMSRPKDLTPHLVEAEAELAALPTYEDEQIAA
jgi:hypothetical protein